MYVPGQILDCSQQSSSRIGTAWEHCQDNEGTQEGWRGLSGLKPECLPFAIVLHGHGNLRVDALADEYIAYVVKEGTLL